MGNILAIFGKQQDDRQVTDVDKAQLQLKSKKRSLEQESNRLSNLIQDLLENAKKLILENKRERAQLCLKQKKIRQDQLLNISNSLMNIEQLLSNIELQKQSNAVFKALQEGTKALKGLQKEVTVEQVEQLNEDSKESYQVQRQIEEALAGVELNEEQENDILDELNRMQAELVPKKETYKSNKVQQETQEEDKLYSQEKQRQDTFNQEKINQDKIKVDNVKEDAAQDVDMDEKEARRKEKQLQELQSIKVHTDQKQQQKLSQQREEQEDEEERRQVEAV